MGRVAGKVCLVTGAGAGLGRADALRLADEGATVIVTDVDAASGAKSAADAGHGASFLPLDVSNSESWLGVIQQIVEAHGRLDVVVNNAGILLPGDVETVSYEDWSRHQRVNLDGTFFGLKYGIAAMKKSGGGSIINIASITALQGFSDFFSYGATKGAIRTMTRHAAVHCQLKGYDIRVNSILPGVISTPMVERLMASAPDGEAPQPTVGIGESSDVAEAVVFLASNESKFINGTELVIDNAASIRPC